jgi:hypothetical protein
MHLHLFPKADYRLSGMGAPAEFETLQLNSSDGTASWERRLQISRPN